MPCGIASTWDRRILLKTMADLEALEEIEAEEADSEDALDHADSADSVEEEVLANEDELENDYEDEKSQNNDSKVDSRSGRLDKKSEVEDTKSPILKAYTIADAPAAMGAIDKIKWVKKMNLALGLSEKRNIVQNDLPSTAVYVPTAKKLNMGKE
jgi:hypothetical protein